MFPSMEQGIALYRQTMTVLPKDCEKSELVKENCMFDEKTRAILTHKFNSDSLVRITLLIHSRTWLMR